MWRGADGRTVVDVKVLLTTAAVLAALLAPSPTANAVDRRPCVSKVESRIHHHGDKRRVVEKDWEVSRLGGAGIMATLLDPAFNTYIVDYPACGYGEDEAGVAVFYREDDNTVRFVMSYWAEDATVHGRPRVR